MPTWWPCASFSQGPPAVKWASLSGCCVPACWAASPPGWVSPCPRPLVTFAYGLQTLGITEAGWLHGLKVVAVAVVAQAVWGMARSLAPDRERASLAFLAAIAMLAYPTAVGQVLIIVLAGLIGWWWLAETTAPRDPGMPLTIGHRGAAVAWVLFFGLLLGLPIAQQWVQS